MSRLRFISVLPSPQQYSRNIRIFGAIFWSEITDHFNQRTGIIFSSLDLILLYRTYFLLKEIGNKSVDGKNFKTCIRNIPSREKVLYLTFDEGPHEHGTPPVLDLLLQHQAPATFFLVANA